MKKFIIFCLAFVCLAGLVPVASAHPGRTDKDGCHHCWTNCEKWGYEYGSVHCHADKTKKAKTEAKKTAKRGI